MFNFIEKLPISHNMFTKNKDLRNYTIKWFLYWMTTMGLYSVTMRVFPIPNTLFTLATLLFFIITSTLAVYFFHTKSDGPRSIFILIFISLIIFSFAIPLINNFLPLPTLTIDSLMANGFYYPILKIETSVIKACDIMFQQIMIYLFINKYLKYSEKKNDIIIKFSVVFFIIHLPLFALFGWLALLFIIPSLLAGIIFSYFILSFKRGLLYSFLIHQVFYIGIAIIYRL